MLHNRTMQSHPLVYLDNAATTFKPQCVIDAVVRYYTEQTTNVHRGDYEISYQVSEAYEKTREDVARFIHANPKEIVFTAGASIAESGGVRLRTEVFKAGRCDSVDGSGTCVQHPAVV